MTRIILYLQGELFQQIEIDLLPHETKVGRTTRQADKDFKENVQARQYQVEANIRQLKSLYWKQIQKVGFDHFVVVVFKSKMN